MRPELILIGVLAAEPSVLVHPASDADHVEPSAAFSSAGLVVAYVERTPMHQAVLAALSTDLAHFGPPLLLSGAGTTEAIRPHVAAYERFVAVVWADASKGDHDVFAAVSNDGGRTFMTPILVAGGPGGQLDPRVAVLPDSSIVVAFQDSEGSTSDDGAITWRVRWTRSADGATFSPPNAIDRTPTHYDLFPSISGLGTPATPLFVSWLREDYSTGLTEIIVAASIDGALDFGPGRRVDSPGPRHQRPRVAAAGSSALVVFDSFLEADGQTPPGTLVLEDSEYLDIHAVTSTNAGIDFGAPFIANTTRTFEQTRADVAVDGMHAAIAWIDHSMPDVRRVVVRESKDGGNTFGAEREASDAPKGVEVHHPAIAVMGPTIAVVYEDARGGTFDVRATFLH